MCRELAAHYETKWVPEFSRIYLTLKNGKYSQDDLQNILEGQIKMEQKIIQKTTDLVICDTEPINFLVWSKVKFGSVPDKLATLAETVHYDYYLLCYPDLDWEKDPLREEPIENGRIFLFNQFEEKLKEKGKPYSIIRGDFRLNFAISVLDSFMLQR